MATGNWTANSNDALHLSLGIIIRDIVCSEPHSSRLTVRANKDKEALGESESFENFHPTFTYPVCACLPVFSHRPANVSGLQIYGEDENIYGYSDLVIDVRCVYFSRTLKSRC
jgi:histone acetyltransferase 1